MRKVTIEEPNTKENLQIERNPCLIEKLPFQDEDFILEVPLNPQSHYVYKQK